MKELMEAIKRLREQKPHPATTLAYEERLGVVEARHVLRQRQNRQRDARKAKR